MSWRVVVRSDAQGDVAEAAQWYEVRQEGLGSEFREAVIQVLDALADNPLLNCRQHSRRNIRWREKKVAGGVAHLRMNTPKAPDDEPASRLLERIKTHHESKFRRDDRK